jgi:hypothetical protein
MSLQNLASGQLARELSAAADRRDALSSGDELRTEALRLLGRIPQDVDVVLAFSTEGYGVGAVAVALSAERGSALRVARAAHDRPYDKAPSSSGQWSWVSVEEALGWAPMRHWVLEWARSHGGTRPCVTSAAA